MAGQFVAKSSRSTRHCRADRRSRRKPRCRPRCQRLQFGLLDTLFVKGTVEDPNSGAHEAFLGEITEVADKVTYFSPRDLWRRPDVVRASLEHLTEAGRIAASPSTTEHSGWS